MVLVTGDDVVGHVVNLAARVTASAAGGELVVTDPVRTAVGDVRGLAFAGPYERSFKGIPEKVPVYLASRSVRRSTQPRTDPADHVSLDGGCP
jgi:adenylate cyclase